MNSRRFVLTVLMTVLVIFGLGTATAAAGPPNVVMIIGDDQAWGDFGFMGHPVIKTPSLDRLASQSLVFTRGYVPASLCRPSLATLATGLYPHQHRITSNDPPKGARGRPQIDYIEQVPTLPRMLARKGYVSLQTGKWWEGRYSRGGFTSGMTLGYPRPGGRHGDAGLAIGRKGMKPIFNFIDSAGERPFFIWYAPFMPHSPHNPPKQLLDKYVGKTDSIHVARYWAMCEWFDWTCGQLLDYLDKKGLSEDTLVLFVTDNGWIQQRGSPRYAPRSKQSPNEGGVRTPIMLRWPGRIEPKVDKQTPVISIDFAPTILTACGLQPTPEMQGVNLLDADALAKRGAIFGEIFSQNAVDVRRPVSSLRYRWCIEGPWKLIVPRTSNEPGKRTELYDLSADPHENKDLAPKQPERVKRMRGEIDAWWPAR